MKILIAEDNKTSGLLLQKVVEKEGHTAVVTVDGLETWEHVLKEEFKMIITDWMMPKLDGISLCRKIREAKLSHYIYIILLTARDQKTDIVEGLEAGADDYIIKPFNLEELRARIRSGRRVIELEDKQHHTLSQLVQSEKLASVGQLAAGIAHEINTPIQYVGDNTRFMQDAFRDLGRIFRQFDSLLQAVKQGSVTSDLVKNVEEAVEEADIEYMKEEIPLAIAQTLEGVDRVSEIVRSMKEFSHPGVKEKTPVDINQAIENTITVSRNEWKYVAEIKLDLDPELPLIPCLPGELNQVFLNMVINAAHAISDVVGHHSGKKGLIHIRTSKQEDVAEIRIKDSGGGIPEEIQTRIFDPFFTTKEIGKGTGQGLAISHAVVKEKHNGDLKFETEPGKGTTFMIRLPIKGEV